MARPALPAAIDIRDCPLETAVFVDWLGELTFTAQRVGTAYFYVCGEGVTAPDPSCMGPYGELVVQGELRRGSAGTPEPLYAVWSVYKAAPCCGWDLRKSPDFNPETMDDFKWLAPGTGPRLGEEAFYTIGSDDKPVFERAMFAVGCTMP